MSLTQEQSDAFSAISYWMVTGDKNLVIDGPAGAKLMAPYTAMYS